jgi:tol-pal system protein YbgF
MRRLLALAPITFIALGGCLASKGDIRLLQQEFAITRSQIGRFDTSMTRANEQRQAQLVASVERIALALQRTSDSLRVLTARFLAFQGTTSEELDVLGRQMIQVQQLMGANVRNLQDTRAQLEQLREQGAAIPNTPVPTSGAAAPQSSSPGALTLYSAGKGALSSGAYSTARESFRQLLTSWPNSDEAPRAMLLIGQSYADEGNKVAADSVYQLVPTRFPKSDAAATALYRRAQMLVEGKRNVEARVLLDRVLKDYPSSDAAVLARDLLKSVR